MSSASSSPDLDLAAEAARDLSPRFRGALIGPDHAEYHQARKMWNGRFDRRPGLIARCMSPADVMEAVRFARGRNIPISARSGYHDFSGYSVIERGLVIDVSPMRGLRMDPVRRTGRAEAGVRRREFTREAQAFGLAAGGSLPPDVTVTGFGIGGGQNLLQRKYGLACDNITSIDLVTADGTFVTTNESEHPDLFWAMRGAGANFGVVTSIEYRLHPVQTVLAGKLVYALGSARHARAREVLAMIRDFNASAPEEVTMLIYVMDDPEVGPSISLILCCLGPIDEAEAVLRPLRPLRSGERPVVDTVAPMSYETLQNMFDARPLAGILYYNKSHFLKRLDDAAIETLCAFYGRHGASGFGALLEPLDGAVRRAGIAANAYPEREADYSLLLFGVWGDPAEGDTHIRHVREAWNALEPFATGRSYVNYLDSDELERVPAAYGPVIYERLRAIKKQYDPANVFRANQNIPPAP